MEILPYLIEYTVYYFVWAAPFILGPCFEYLPKKKFSKRILIIAAIGVFISIIGYLSDMKNPENIPLGYIVITTPFILHWMVQRSLDIS